MVQHLNSIDMIEYTKKVDSCIQENSFFCKFDYIVGLCWLNIMV